MLKLIFIKLLEISIQTSFFILAIMFIRLCFKQMPKRYMCILWALLAIRLILPFEITSTFSLVPDTSRLQQLSEISNDDSANHTEKIPAQGSSGVEATYTEKIPAQDSSGVVSTHTYKKGPGTVMVTIDIVHLLSFLWLAGFIGFIGYGFISYLHLKYSLKEAVSDMDNIWYSVKIPSPFVLGYIKPRIYIPFSIENEQLPYIIAHEKAHIAHLDHLCKLLGFVLLCIYWFNPFIWTAYQLYCKDLELACDERVIEKLGDTEKKPYSEALLACSITNKALLKSPLAFSETALKERIVNILHYKKPGFWSIMLAVITCIIASVCFLTNTEPAKSREEEFIEQTTNELLDQVADFPGNALVTDEDQLTIVVSAKDYECVVATDPATNKPVYVWSEGSDKVYPLEVIDGKVQDVPAKVISEKDIAKYAFGDNLLGMTYKLHPYGTKQYILRENGMVNVNIAYESEGHVDFHYLTFQTNEAQQTALLTDYGLGYYLLQSNDVNALKAFREAYTGTGHTLPSDTSHLPWNWILELNNEVNDAPKLKSSQIPVVIHRYDYTDFTSYNLNDSYNGFIIAEKRIDGEVFIEYHYQFKQEDLVLLTDLNDSKVVSITYNGEQKPLPDQILRVSRSGGNGYDTVYYVDETGDGQQELIFESAGGGTGAWDSSCDIFDPDTMEQYPIDLDVSHITSKLKIALTEMEPEGGYNSLHFTIEYEDQKKEGAVSFDKEKHAAMLEPDVTLEEANAYFTYTPDETTNIVAYNSETGRIETEVWLWVNNTAFQQYIGTIRAAYIWDEAIGKFVINPDTVVIWGNS